MHKYNPFIASETRKRSLAIAFFIIFYEDLFFNLILKAIFILSIYRKKVISIKRHMHNLNPFIPSQIKNTTIL